MASKFESSINHVTDTSCICTGLCIVVGWCALLHVLLNVVQRDFNNLFLRDIFKCFYLVKQFMPIIGLCESLFVVWVAQQVLNLQLLKRNNSFR